ncbi:hypothetical protein [Prevotella sp. HUN102]|uniref:hypothetical protein n=1 Tax=Prevotella sp. HUN102 TaxID=1392486 RepID=UPI00056123DC|nr:hypothetical protein [Prevotella sp. HUN102]
MEKKQYEKPRISVVQLDMHISIMAGSPQVGISDDPATEPALSKKWDVTDDEGNESSEWGYKRGSVWED